MAALLRRLGAVGTVGIPGNGATGRRIDLDGEIILCDIRGNLKDAVTGYVNPVAVGDQVFVVGAPFDNTRGLNAGQAFVWFGGPEMTGQPDLILDDSNGFDYFGFAVAGVGDLDGEDREIVDWALARFEEAGVDARAEAFEMPELWLEGSASTVVAPSGLLPAT